jgi:hypothetical protein
MLLGAGLPTELWGEAVHTASYLSNGTPRRGNSDQVASPEELWTGRKPDLGHLRVFGCVAFAQLAKEQRGFRAWKLCFGRYLFTTGPSRANTLRTH